MENVRLGISPSKRCRFSYGLYGRTTDTTSDVTRTPLPMELGKPQRYDHEYERNDTASIFMFCEPKAGIRNVSAHEQRTMIDWAQQIKHLQGRAIPKR